MKKIVKTGVWINKIYSAFSKQKFSYWFIIGIGIGTVWGSVFDNMGAGICLGTSCSAIVTLLINDFKEEH